MHGIINFYYFFPTSKNSLTLYLDIISFTIFFVFSICSCQKERCKDCQANYRFTYQGNSNGYADEQWCADYVTQQLGYSSWLEYTTALTASYPNNTQSALREICGDELKNVNNSTVSLQTTIGDSISGIYKYNWSENWDCK